MRYISRPKFFYLGLPNSALTPMSNECVWPAFPFFQLILPQNLPRHSSKRVPLTSFIQTLFAFRSWSCCKPRALLCRLLNKARQQAQIQAPDLFHYTLHVTCTLSLSLYYKPPFHGLYVMSSVSMMQLLFFHMKQTIRYLDPRHFMKVWARIESLVVHIANWGIFHVAKVVGS